MFQDILCKQINILQIYMNFCDSRLALNRHEGDFLIYDDDDGDGYDDNGDDDGYDNDDNDDDDVTCV
jgi:hypothetical protein